MSTAKWMITWKFDESVVAISVQPDESRVL